MFKRRAHDAATKELIQELRALRSTIDSIIQHYGMNIKAQVEEMLRILEGKEVIVEDRPNPDKRDVEQMLEKLRALRVKPKKGRLKDLKRVEKLLDELSQMFPSQP